MSIVSGLNGSFVNTDNSNGTSYTFTDTTVPHTKPLCLNYLSGGKNKKRYNNMKSKRNKSRKNKSRKNRSRKYKRKLKGGYSQFQNNQPYQMNYSVGSEKPILSALANPVPYFIDQHSKELQHLDNYNHYTNKGFASKGWF